MAISVCETQEGLSSFPRQKETSAEAKAPGRKEEKMDEKVRSQVTWDEKKTPLALKKDGVAKWPFRDHYDTDPRSQRPWITRTALLGAGPTEPRLDLRDETRMPPSTAEHLVLKKSAIVNGSKEALQ